jgi:hypothetical protein
MVAVASAEAMAAEGASTNHPGLCSRCSGKRHFACRRIKMRSTTRGEHWVIGSAVISSGNEALRIGGFGVTPFRRQETETFNYTATRQGA